MTKMEPSLTTVGVASIDGEIEAGFVITVLQRWTPWSGSNAETEPSKVSPPTW